MIHNLTKNLVKCTKFRYLLQHFFYLYTVAPEKRQNNGYPKVGVLMALVIAEAAVKQTFLLRFKLLFFFILTRWLGTPKKEETIKTRSIFITKSLRYSPLFKNGTVKRTEHSGCWDRSRVTNGRCRHRSPTPMYITVHSQHCCCRGLSGPQRTFLGEILMVSSRDKISGV